MNNDLTIKLYQSIADANEERVFKHWHASSISECPRAHWMMRKGYKSLQKPSGAKVIRWSAGHLLEESIRPHIPSLFEGAEVISNQRLTSEAMDMTGEYDNLAVDDGIIVEVKSVHDYAFIERDGRNYLKEQEGFNSRGQKKWKPKETPYLHHELQNHCYVLLLEESGVKIKGIKYVYISLSGRIVVYETEVKQELLDNVKKRLEVLNKAWESDTPPPCICEEGHPLWDTTMQYCNFRSDTGCCEIKE